MSRGWVPNCKQKTRLLLPFQGGGWQRVPLTGRQLGAGWLLAGAAQRLSRPPTQGTGGDTRRFAPSQGWVSLGAALGIESGGFWVGFLREMT